MDFEATYQQYGEMLYRIAYIHLGDTYSSEDILQDVFVTLYSNAPKFKTEEHRKAWLIRVTHNKCINYLKKASFNSSDVDDLQIPAQADDDDTRIDILQQIFALPTRYKTVVILYYYNDYSVEEIAKILKISKSAVKMRLKRSRELLKIQLEDYDNEQK